MSIHHTLNGIVFPVKHNLTEEELKTHIHPIIDEEISKNKPSSSSKNIVRFASLMNKEHINKLLNNMKEDENINYTHDTELPNHVRNAILGHAIKTKNHKLIENIKENELVDFT